jgi:hypothetical protein
VYEASAPTMVLWSVTTNRSGPRLLPTLISSSGEVSESLDAKVWQWKSIDKDIDNHAIF